MFGTRPSCLCTASRIGLEASGTSPRAGMARRDMTFSLPEGGRGSAVTDKNLVCSIRKDNQLLLGIQFSPYGIIVPPRSHDDPPEGGRQGKLFGCKSRSGRTARNRQPEGE